MPKKLEPKEHHCEAKIRYIPFMYRYVLEKNVQNTIMINRLERVCKEGWYENSVFSFEFGTICIRFGKG